MRPLLALAVAFVASCLHAAGTKPNFLIIAVDDLNHYSGAQRDQPDNFLRKLYPDDTLRRDVGRRLTPNIDRLASESVAFTRAYSPSPLCGPSRTALLGGIPPHLSGYYQHAGHFRLHDSLKGVVTLPQYLKANGYFTTGLGKVFHKQSVEVREGVRHDWPDLDFSWSRWIERRVGANAEQRGDEAPGRLDLVAERNRTPSPYSPNDGLFTFGRSNIPVESTFDFENARFTADLLRNGRATIRDLHGENITVSLPADQPFLIACGLFLPHLPWVVPEEFIARFPVDEMQVDQALIDWATDDIADLPDGIARQWLGKDFDSLIAVGEKIHGKGGMVHAWRAALQHYLGAIAFADHCLGQLVDAIEQSPHRNNTVVMLWGDHGWHLGDKRRFRKHALWEAANHTTFLWLDPKAPHSTSGATCDRLVSLQDIYPTVAARAGLPIPSHVHGRDLGPLLADPAAPWENLVLHTYNPGNHTIRTETHRYIRYADGGRELYNLVSDPFEITNLFADPAHAKVLSHLDAQLDRVLGRDAAFYRQP